MTHGFAIIGCGLISKFHARAINDTRGARLVACYNRTLSAMLKNDKVHVVVIGTPSGAHMEPAVAAAKAGKHVIVEKPLEITLKRCDKIIEACRANNVTLSTIFPSRFHDSAGEMKRAIDTGRFGRLTIGDAYVKWFRTQQYYDSGKWRGTWELDGGGALMNQAVHSIDLLLWLMGPVVEVTAHAAMLAHERIAVEDTVVATLKFASGALGVIEATTAAFPGYLKRIEIHGSTGSAVMEEEDIIKWDFAKEQKRDAAIREAASAKKSGGGGASDPAAIGHHGHARQFRDVLDAIKKGKPPLIDGPQGRQAVETILAIYKAAETGKAVKLPLAGDPALKARKV
jgi:UDP-N-acetyl-2-amino-2-deoxyglucuronate dehydrogenase